MAITPGGIHDTPDGDRKRLMQRADSFAVGSGTRDSKDRDDIEDFDDTMESVIRKAESTPAEAEPDQGKELEKHREDHAQMEAERRGSSSPSHQPLLGLSVLPGIPGALPLGQMAEAQAQQRSRAVTDKEEAVVESVSPELVNGLKKAGLGEPIVTLDDPRLSGSAERLNRWFVLSLQGHERVYVWSDQACHQILTVGMRETTLESAVGETVETVIRKGRFDQKRIAQRSAPGRFNPDV
ncbi:MAG: hypothetical protein WC314_15440 [Vulcanimicrobiota bacterium]